MAMRGVTSVRAGAASSAEPLLEPGDRLSRDEFERRYERMPQVKKAELIEGTVFMPLPVRAQKHAQPHSHLSGWLVLYASETPNVGSFDNPSLRLDLDNEPQPDLVLMKGTTSGGQVKISADDYIEGAPELVVEIVASSRAYDMHQKKDVYRRNGVQEYLAWVTAEQCMIWWQLQGGEYREITPDADRLIKSVVFPGLWLDSKALLGGDLRGVLDTLRRGLDSREHQSFRDPGT